MKQNAEKAVTIPGKPKYCPKCSATSLGKDDHAEMAGVTAWYCLCGWVGYV